ncbi:MAG: DMT family transporter [Granulosicoccus sp.]
MNAELQSGSIIKGVGLALLGFSIFSLHDALIKSIDDIPVFQTVFFVVLFSFVPFTFFLAVDRTERSLRPRLPGLVALRCLFSTVGLLCVFHAFKNLPLAQVYALLFAAPILITLLAIPILGERIKLIRWFAILLGMGGVLIVLDPGGFLSLALSAGNTSVGAAGAGKAVGSGLTIHHFIALGAAACVACSSVVTRKIGAREHSVTLIIYPMLTNIVVSGVLMSQVYQPMAGVTLLKLAAIGLLSVMGQSLMIQAYRNSEAQFVAPMQYSQMLWALLYGAFVFNESVDKVILAGSAVIVLSGLLFIWRELVASVRQPVLRRRNLRMSGGLLAKPAEAYDVER